MLGLSFFFQYQEESMWNYLEKSENLDMTQGSMDLIAADKILRLPL